MVIARLLKRFKPLLTGMSLEEKREGKDRLGEIFRVPKEIAVRSANAGHVPMEMYSPKDALPFVMMFCHGGAYMTGTLCSSRVLAASMAEHVGVHVLSFEYRLSPENPYPAALEDAHEVYAWLLGEGIAPDQIALAGDSAGGGLALALALKLKDENMPLPGCILAISPWTDLTMSQQSHKQKHEDDPSLNEDLLFQAAHAYIGDHLPIHPYISPAYGDFTDFPPTLFHVGSEEILLDDSRVVARRMERAGVKATLRIYDGMWHVFHAFPVKETKEAMEEIREFLLCHLKRKEALPYEHNE